MEARRSANGVAVAGRDASGTQISVVRGRIGSQLSTARRELYSVGQALSEVLEPAGANLTDEALRLLMQQTCRIAVVGQMKAGKSSFINALVQQPELLPTDINPATASVTQLHFNQSSPGGHAVVFRFLSPTAWEKLAQGNGRLRELTQRLVPGFEESLLRQNIAAARERASRRLGSKFEALLGQAHAYPQVDRSLLQRYVCATDVLARSDAGLYADITESAEIYLGGGPFDFPVTLIDTPGTNDPFLLRDEITRSYLDKADAYIVVLTAHQPLADGDVALLRILRGLHKERIVVFVNRIDELDDPVNDTASVLDFVRERLAVEFPAFEIPIIAGSAKWGATKGGWLAATPPPGFGTVPFGSGLAEMATVLDTLLTRSHCAYVIRQIASCFEEMSRSCDAATRQQLDDLRRTHQNAQITSERLQIEMSKLRLSQQNTSETQQSIEGTRIQFEAQLREVLAEDLALQRTRMIDIVESYAGYERDRLEAALTKDRVPRTWVYDTSELRRVLKQEFVDGFRRSEMRLVDLSTQVMRGLRRLATALLPGSSPPAEPEAAPNVVALPNVLPLSSHLELDLQHPWWAQWRERPSIQERAAALQALIEAEFAPLVDELLTSHRQVLEAHITNTAGWSFAICNNILQALSKRQERLAQHYATIKGGAAGSADPETVQQQAETIKDLERRFAVSQAAARQLSGLTRSIDLWFH